MVSKLLVTLSVFLLCRRTMDVAEEFDLPVIPQVVSLMDSNTDSDCELNVTSLDKTLQPEDFGAEFG